MTQEEKAKRYDEAIERANELNYVSDKDSLQRKTVEHIFPELKESDDEKIRKELLKHLREVASGKSLELSTTDYERWATWVENQGKITKEWSEMKINNIQRELQDMVDLKQKTEQGEQKSVEERQYTRKIIDTTTNEVIGYQTDDGLFTPETRPAWSEEDEVHVNSLLKRLEGLCRNEFAMTRFAINEDEDWLKSLKDKVQPKQGEQKPVDKIQLGKKYKCIASPRYSTFRIGEIYKPEDKFLCSLMNFCSDCFEPIEDEQKPAYTKEYDFHGIKFILKFAKGDIIKDKKCGEVSTIEDFSYDTGLYTHTYGQFPITIQDNYEIIAQKPAWSKEDEKIIRRIDSLLYSQCKIHGSEYEEIHNWLKSLRPQNTWKPSEEQMDALEDAITDAISSIQKNMLNSLFTDLKKL